MQFKKQKGTGLIMSEKYKNDSTTLFIDLIEGLAEFNKKMFSNLITNEVYVRILDTSFCMVNQTEICLLFIFDRKNNELKLVEKRGTDDQDVKKKTIRLGEGIVGKAILDGIKRINYDSDSRFKIISKKIISRKKIKTSVCLPLKVFGKVIGILILYLNRSDRFLPIEEVMLDILAGNAAIAIQNANLYKRLRYESDEMEFVVQIARDITSSLDFNRVLKNILRVTQKIANTNITFLWYKYLTTKKWRRMFPENFPESGLQLPEIENGQGIIGHVLKTGKPYLCNDVTKDPYYFDTWHETKSEIAIPLIIDNEVNGILDVESTRNNAFTKHHLRLLSILAGEAAIALRNAQLFEIAEQKTQQFITLRQIEEALSQQKSLKEILSIIAQESLNIVGHGKKICFVMLIDKEKSMLETKAISGGTFENDYLDFVVNLNQRSIVSWVARNGKPRIVPDVTNDPEYLKLFPSTKSEICVPLLFRNEVIGVIDIESSELNAFKDQDVEFLLALADNTAIATKIGELCDIRLRQLEVLYKTGTRITSSLNLGEVLNLIAKEALTAIGSKDRILYVQLIDTDKEVIEVKVAYGENFLFKDYLGIKISLNEGISGQVIQSKKYYLCNNVKENSHYLEINPDVKSELTVPIIFNDEVIGLINAESFKENDFGQYEVHLLQQLANQAGVAIENARLNEGLTNTLFQLNQAFELSLIGETLAGLNHDIRTCISLISGEAQWIEQLYEENQLTIDEAVNAMKNIERYVERMQRLTDDLSRKSQQSPIKFQKSNIADIIKESVYLMHSKASHYHITMNIDYPSLQFLAEVDNRRLKRVFTNVIMNAIDAMPEGGSLKIAANKNEDYCEIKFRDTGKGIAESEMNKVWDRFFTTKQEGSGLGLAICKRIVESDHNGQIRIESKINKGTTVKIKLPITQNEEIVSNE